MLGLAEFAVAGAAVGGTTMVVVVGSRQAVQAPTPNSPAIVKIEPIFLCDVVAALSRELDFWLLNIFNTW
jgi:hypothetical protein